jgi:ATP-dependent DNA helicase RecG
MHSSIEKLQKLFRLERERGYDNRAVVGGLDKLLPAWESEARATNLPEGAIEMVQICLQNYPSIDQNLRADIVDKLIQDINALVPSAPPRTGSRSAPSRPAPRPAEPRPRAEIPPIPAESPRYPEEDYREDVKAPTQPPRPVYKAPEPRQPGLSAPLTVVNGIGPKIAQSFEKLGLKTLEDLLYYFPRRYDDYTRLKPINRLEYGEEVTVLGTIQAIQTRPIRGGMSQLTEVVLSDGTGNLRLSWFNRPWIATQFHKGDQVVVSGKLDQYLGRLVMNAPEVEELEKEHLHTSRIVPVYALTATVTQKSLRKLIYQAVTFWGPRVPDHMPASIRSALKMLDLGTALVQAHFPDSQDSLDLARWRLAFDEILLLQLGVLRQKQLWKSAEARVFETPEEWLQDRLALLPYQLTGAQLRSIADIRSDLGSGRPMDRLLQGDVGSGKTVVAAMAMAIVARTGAQAAIMAPTGILAEQHHRGLSRLLCSAAEGQEPFLQPEQIRLLVGDTTAAEKQSIREGIANGNIKLLIGTHALIEDPVVFNDLQLVIIDEQHRFGVAQRAALRSKGNSPHLLVMTATPIPRSLALTVYGDLDLSVMDEMPAGRQPIETHIVRPLERERAYQLIQSQIAQGHQAFIIYPLVEQSEKDEGLAAVEDHARLQKEVFPKLKLGLLHGRLRPEEKDAVMTRFRNREFDILVSTSVVEVGVDIPNATVMLIEGANRFGLAQLHQFRGRVGRGDAASFCLLIPDKEDAAENQRLNAMEESNDGFVLAERDLEQRGPGDFLGTRQAGLAELQMAKLTDVHLIEKARQQAQNLFQADPDLSRPENRLLAEKLDNFWGNGKGDVS